MATLTILPDVESALMFALVPMFPDIRFVTSMPAGDPKMITARISRVSGAGLPGTGFWLDRPVVDIDVWGFKSNSMDASIAARSIQASILALAGIKVQNGVIQHVTTVSGPRPLPEVNPNLVRYNSSYEVRIHP